jgi:hypothetical protein
LLLLKEGCTELEYRDYAMAIAKAIHCTQSELMGKVFAAHPELEQQVEAKIAQYGMVI